MSAINQIKVIPVIDLSVRNLCSRPYYNHPKGCPNYGRKKGCPPNCPTWNIMDSAIAVWCFWTKFDIGSHRERMREKHPNWSKRQLDCCLYWQGRARKPLNDFLKTEWNFPGFYKTIKPEAMGINVTATMALIGIELEWPPDKWTYQIAMGGWLK